MDCCNYVQPYAQAGHHHYYHHPPPPPQSPHIPLHHHPQQQQLLQQQQQQQHHAQLPQQQQIQPQQLGQQPAYCYSEAAAAYAYSNGPAAIEGAGGGGGGGSGARYSAGCRLLPPAYPTDYVYNPKEARLRKAMREQTRELSRSTTTTTPSSSSSNSTTNNINSSSSNTSSSTSSILGGSTTSAAVAAAMSPLPGAASAANRIIAGPWFPLGGAPPPPATHPKPILSPRVMAAHQRTLDKTKDAIRKQLECGLSSNGAGYPGSGYPGGSDYTSSSGAAANGQVVTPDNNGDYCAVSDFADGQKWHPYQNGMNAYHSRSALMSKMNSLHRSMQSPAPHAAPSWGQFCNVPFSTSQSAMMRNNRHMVFLQEQQQQQQQQHCGYPTAAADEMQMSYEAKVQDELARRLHSSYSAAPVSSREDQQVKSPLTGLHLAQLPLEEPKHTSLSNGHHHHHQHHHLQQQQQQQQLHHQHSHHLPPQPPHPHNQRPAPPPDDVPRWGTPRPPSVASSSCTTDAILDRDSDSTPQQTQQQQPQQQRSSSSNSSSKQPLPGFQQAFGSTEIGRFSRSELFASLVEAASNSTNNSILSEGPPKSRTAFPQTSSTDPLRTMKRNDTRDREKAEDGRWLEIPEVLGLRKHTPNITAAVAPSAVGRSLVSAHSAQEWRPQATAGHHRARLPPLPTHNVAASRHRMPLMQDECLDLRVPSRKRTKDC